MWSISFLGSFPSEVSNTFLHQVLDVAIEDINQDAIHRQKLFEWILPRELDPNYMPRLETELSGLWLEIDPCWNMAPILCQNVSSHVDQIQWEPLSIVANVSYQSWLLRIHEGKNGKIIHQASLERGKIFCFDHHHDWHSVEYTGNPKNFLVLVRASVRRIISK